jgi:hypothetical protein
MVKLGIVIWYQANKNYIAQNLCENRDKPEMKCCGKCYLKKQLRNADNNTEKQNKQAPLKTMQLELASCVLPAPAQWDPVPLPPSAIIQNPAGARHFGISAIHSIFHPPSCA